MGYVWCDGYVWDMCGVRYVWDMCGVRYANNLLKNPATKRLSGKKLRPEPQCHPPSGNQALLRGLLGTNKQGTGVVSDPW